MKKIIILAIFSFISIVYADVQCDLTKVPLTREERCSEFKIDDRALNSNYKLLLKKLDKKNSQRLISQQREWVRWRDERCDAIQESISCGNSICDGVAHDSCVIDLTIKRNSEINIFINEKNSTNFDFSKNYVYE